MSEAEYLATFCNEKRIRNRRAVYISSENHQKLVRVISALKDHYVTAMSLADAILAHHFETYGELLNQFCNEDIKRILDGLKTHEGQLDDEDYEPEE
jgi:hypothetical protein